MQNDPNSQASSFSWFPVSPNTLKLAIIRKANLIFQLISLSNATLLSIVFFACGVHKLNYIKNYLFRDDINMMSMKIIRFSRPPNPLVHLRAKFFHPLDPWFWLLFILPRSLYLFFGGFILLCMQLSKNIKKLFIIIHVFSTHFEINLFYLYNLKT